MCLLHREISLPFECRTFAIGEYHIQYSRVILEARNRKAVRVMLNAMNYYMQRLGVVVFGQDHTNGLIDEFIRQTNKSINIIVVKLFQTPTINQKN